MKKASCNFSCMVPTIIFEENLVSELILITRQKNLSQLVLIAQVLVKNSKIEFHCSTLVTDPDSEISVREDEVPIYVDILPESEFKQPANIEVDDFQKNFYRMMDETSNQYNANNIYSLISDVAYISNQLNVRISLFCPKSSIEIEEIGSSDAPTVCSIPGATYRFPKDKKFKDPNSIYAIYYGITGIKDPRIYSLSYSIYLQQHKQITAAFNNKLYRITFHENEEFELLSTTFNISKPSSITARFTQPQYPNTNSRDNNLTMCNENSIFANAIRDQETPQAIFTIPKELINSMKEMKNEIHQLQEQVKYQNQMIEEKFEQHDQEIKTLLQTILTQLKTTHNQEKTSKIFPHRQICRKPVVPLEISLSSYFESQTTSDDDFLHQRPQSQPLHQFQQLQQNPPKQKAITRSRSENISIQAQQLPDFNQNQTTNLNQLFPMNSTNSTNSITSINSIDSDNQIQQQEKQHAKYSANLQASFEKRRANSKDTLNTSAPTISSSKRNSQQSTANSINTSAIVSSTNINKDNNTTNTNINNSKVNLSNIKYMNNGSSRKAKTSALNIENRPDNDDFSSKFSKPSSRFTNQIFNEPSFDISAQIPDSLNESPTKRESSNVPSELSFLLNSETSMDTNRFLEVIGFSKTPNP